jgi:hypothetical protein
MRSKLGLTRTTAELVKEIKATMDAPLPPYNFTVIQTLCDHERTKVFNQYAAKASPDAKEKSDKEIRDITAAIEGRVPARRVRRLADRFWKWDHAADRRFREGSTVPYKGRPDVYDPDMALAFADTIARAAGRKCFSLGHHGDNAITQKSEGGPMLRVLVASVEWAMVAGWLAAAPFGTAPPTVKPEGILTVFKRVR